MDRMFAVATARSLLCLVLAGPVPALAQNTPPPLIRPIAVQPARVPLRAIADAAASDRIVAPAPAATVSRPASATLRGASYEESVSGLGISRKLTGAQVRASPIQQFGALRVDFKPMLQNPKALFNVAQRMRAATDLVQVRADTLEAAEAPRGLVVRSFLSYRLKPGACSNAGRRAQVTAMGVNCFTQITPAARNAGFSDARDVRYVADPGLRAQALAAANTRGAAIQQDVNASVQNFRAMLANPAKRAQIDAEIGPAESARLAALGDADLAGELVNNAETKIEQVFFVPSQNAPPGNFLLGGVMTTNTGPNWGMLAQAMQNMPPPSPLGEQLFTQNSATIKLPGDTFITGFTYGREHEWKQRVETTISWCWVGCKKTYYAELGAGFSYGLGLRFPIRVGGEYRYNSTPAGQRTATFRPVIAPFDGGPSDYAAAGVSGSQLFGGKELVAEVKAHAGGAVYLPVIGGLSGSFDIGKDFTEKLPAPFTYGQFAPPSPDKPLGPANIVFDDFDLIGGRANFGVAGGQLFPMIEAKLTSESLTFDMRDEGKGTTQKVSSGMAPIPLAISPADQSSHITLSNPNYVLAFNVTPGINARLFIDLAVWSNKWDWPILFPQLGLKIPAEGVAFACHSGTVCNRRYDFDPYQGKGAPDQAAILKKWGDEFDTYWLPKCADEACRWAIKIHRLDTVLGIKQKLVPGALTLEQINGGAGYQLVKAAEHNAAAAAAQTITESGFRVQVQQAQDATAALAAAAEAEWVKKCSEGGCLGRVKALAAQMRVRAKEVATASPSLPPQSVANQVNAEFAPRFQSVINFSKTAAAAAQAGVATIAAPQGGIKAPGGTFRPPH